MQSEALFAGFAFYVLQCLNSFLPSFGRWGVLVRMTQVGRPMSRAQLSSVGKPEEGFFFFFIIF